MLSELTRSCLRAVQLIFRTLSVRSLMAQISGLSFLKWRSKCTVIFSIGFLHFPMHHLLVSLVPLKFDHASLTLPSLYSEIIIRDFFMVIPVNDDGIALCFCCSPISLYLLFFSFQIDLFIQVHYIRSLMRGCPYV